MSFSMGQPATQSLNLETIPCLMKKGIDCRWIRFAVCCGCFALFCGLTIPVAGQGLQTPEDLQFGLQVPPDVDRINGRSLEYLAKTQLESGSWQDGIDNHGRGQANCGLAGLCLMAFLSNGDDPNTGPYAENIHAAVRYLIKTQNPETGFFPTTMYNHGFALLALSEVYGAIDEELLWTDVKDFPKDRKRSIAKALKMAVDLAVRSQDQNPQKAWRYAPNGGDADTSVTGTVVIGLLAARNAGISVPDASIEEGMNFIHMMTSRRSGLTRYTLGLSTVTDSPNLSAIHVLTLAIANQRDTDTFDAAKERVKGFIRYKDTTFPFYNTYYMAQALFQNDYESWVQWNELTIRRMRRLQKEDGSFESKHGSAYATAMACLSLALNYRFLPIYER